jgi:hypothetical protein
MSDATTGRTTDGISTRDSHRRNLLRALGGVLLVAALVAMGMLVDPGTASAATSAPAGVSAPAASPKQVKAKAAKRFFRGCKPSGRFKDRRFDYDVNAVLAGRCATSRVKGIQLISSYQGHHPSATKALDIMVNMRGSCSAGRETGNKVARYMMNNAGVHGVRYVIWKNSYWAYGTGKRDLRNWRHGIHSGSCTTRHYDHVHVAFR